MANIKTVVNSLLNVHVQIGDDKCFDFSDMMI